MQFYKDMAEVTLTDQNFEQEVLQSSIPVLIDFWAPWCAPCRIVAPIIEEFAKEYDGKLKVGKMNVDENPQSASRYGVMSIPTLVIFNRGNPVKSMVGAQPKERLKKEIDEVLGS